MTDHEHPDISDPRVRAVLDNPDAVIIDALNRSANGETLSEEDRQQVEFAAKLSIARSMAKGGIDPQTAVDKLNDADSVSVGIDHGLLFIAARVGSEDLTKVAPLDPDDTEVFDAFVASMEAIKEAANAAEALPTIEDSDEAWDEAKKDPEIARMLAALDSLPVTDEEGGEA